MTVGTNSKNYLALCSLIRSENILNKPNASCSRDHFVPGLYNTLHGSSMHRTSEVFVIHAGCSDARQSNNQYFFFNKGKMSLPIAGQRQTILTISNTVVYSVIHGN